MSESKSSPSSSNPESAGYRRFLEGGLAQVDPAVQAIIDFEVARQREKLILIASESICPRAVREANASEFAHLYAEGYPAERMLRCTEAELLEFGEQLSAYRRDSNRRFYKGCEYADLIESLAIRRAAEIFGTRELPADRIHVNVQPLSGAAANNAVYDAFVKPGETVMGMQLAHGGHLTHGSPVNRSGKYYKIVSYGIRSDTGRIDYDEIRDLARQHRPRMIIGGYSAYPWKVDWRIFRAIADEVGAILMADISHYAGLVVAGLYPSPVGLADVTTLTTHKTLCGPRGAIILTTDPGKAKAIDFSVFPGEQGGPHINNIAARAVSFKIAATPEFRDLQERIVKNCRALAESLERRGLKIAYGGTETHLCLVDLRSVSAGGETPLRGEMASRLLDLCGITCNKNTIAGDKSAFEPSAIRLGTPWITQRGLRETDMDTLAGLIHHVLAQARPYTLSSPKGLQHLAKLPREVFAEVQAGVAALVDAADPGPEHALFEYPHYQPARRRKRRLSPLRAERKSGQPAAEIARQGAALLDLSSMGLFKIQGNRAWAFLQNALTLSLAGIQPGQSASASLLDPDGKVIDRVRIHCMRPEEFLLQTSARYTDEVHQWLALLSDGYVQLDPEDPWRTLDGPVSIEALHSGANDGASGHRWCNLVLLGSAAGDVASRLSPALCELKNDACAELCLQGIPVKAAKTGQTPSGIRIDLFVRLEDAGKLWQAAVAAGATAASANAFVQKLPAAHAEAAPSDSGKPFFIGQRGKDRGMTAKPCFEFQAAESELRHTCLYALHTQLTSANRIIPFGGWAMPVCYGQTSIAEEHQAVRTAAALFDVSHMGILEFSGPGATRFLDLLTTNEVARLPVGRAHYSFLLSPEGLPLDDITLYRLAADRYMMVVNASNAEKVEAWIRGVNERRWAIDLESPGQQVDASATIRNLKSAEAGADQRVDLAFQGPRSQAVLERLMGRPEDVERLRSLRRFAFLTADLRGINAILSATGYTGEPVGYELYVHPDRAADLWRLLLESGADQQVIPAGLGARDSTRIEAGYPLYGHELAGPYAISPSEAGYPSFVRLNKPYFVGRGAALQGWKNRTRTVVRFQIGNPSARAARSEDQLSGPTGQPAGQVTSCTRVGETQIGLAIVSREFRAEGTLLTIAPRPRTKRDEGRQAEPIPARVISRFLEK